MDTFIQNKGITKTLVHANGENHINEIGWEADYDGQFANVAVGVNDQGKMSQYQFQLDNHDLEQLLSIPSINQTLDQRLARDFRKKNLKKPLIMILEDPVPKIKISNPSLRKTYLSSPTKPLKIVRRHTRRHHPKTSSSRKKHKTYRVYKVHRRSSRRH